MRKTLVTLAALLTIGSSSNLDAQPPYHFYHPHPMPVPVVPMVPAPVTTYQFHRDVVVNKPGYSRERHVDVVRDSWGNYHRHVTETITKRHVPATCYPKQAVPVVVPAPPVPSTSPSSFPRITIDNGNTRISIW